MAIAWPPYFPIALREGYAVQAADVVERTEMEGGPVRLRQIAPPGPEAISVTWMMSAALQQLFRAFFRHELASGAALLDLPILTDGGEVTMQTVNFAEPPRYTLVGARNWRVSATVQTRQPQTMTEAEYADFKAALAAAGSYQALQALNGYGG